MEKLASEKTTPLKPDAVVAMRAAVVIAADRRRQYPLPETPLDLEYSYESD